MLDETRMEGEPPQDGPRATPMEVMGGVTGAELAETEVQVGSAQGAAEPAGGPVPPEGAAAAPPPADASGPERRGLKLVVKLEPVGDAGYRAQLGVGRDGCDPLLRTLEVRDMVEVLEAAPELIAEAQARWHEQPRYPKAPPPAKKGTGQKKDAAGKQPGGTKAPAGGQQGPAPTPSKTPKTAEESESTQLTLFG